MSFQPQKMVFHLHRQARHLQDATLRVDIHFDQSPVVWYLGSSSSLWQIHHLHLAIGLRWSCQLLSGELFVFHLPRFSLSQLWDCGTIRQILSLSLWTYSYLHFSLYSWKNRQSDQVIWLSLVLDEHSLDQMSHLVWRFSLKHLQICLHFQRDPSHHDFNSTWLKTLLVNQPV